MNHHQPDSEDGTVSEFSDEFLGLAKRYDDVHPEVLTVAEIRNCMDELTTIKDVVADTFVDIVNFLVMGGIETLEAWAEGRVDIDDLELSPELEGLFTKYVEPFARYDATFRKLIAAAKAAAEAAKEARTAKRLVAADRHNAKRIQEQVIQEQAAAQEELPF
jgi:hypothetical protein